MGREGKPICRAWRMTLMPSRMKRSDVLNLPHMAGRALQGRVPHQGLSDGLCRWWTRH